MMILRSILLIVLAIAPISSYSQNRHRARITNLKPLNVLIGDWILRSSMIPLNGIPATESGTMTCISLYDSTYVECSVQLTNTKGHVRSYKQFLTYNPDMAQFEVLYLYSGTPMRIVEQGNMSGSSLRTTTTIVSAPGREETITTLLKVVHPDSLWFESRSSATNGEVDYTCGYSRRK